VLDTFHIAGYDYADPSVPSFTRSDAQSRMAATLDGIKQIPAEKIFFLQTCDAEKLDQPITEGESLYYNPEQPARMSWSRNCRLFPYEEDRGGFMPVEEVTKAILATGFEGFIR
jgi:4-hydroxyphenylpyruvate dioxygenase